MCQNKQNFITTTSILHDGGKLNFNTCE